MHRKEVLNRWHGGSITSILPSGRELPNVRAYRNERSQLCSVDAVEYNIGALDRVQGLPSRVSRDFCSIGTFSQGANLNPINYGLSESRKRKGKCESDQRSIEIAPVANKNYKLLGFSEQFSDANDEVDWRWLLLGIAGFVGVTSFL